MINTPVRTGVFESYVCDRHSLPASSPRQASCIEIEGIVSQVADQHPHGHCIGRHRALEGVWHEERWCEVVVDVVVNLHAQQTTPYRDTSVIYEDQAHRFILLGIVRTSPEA